MTQQLSATSELEPEPTKPKSVVLPLRYEQGKNEVHHRPVVAP